MSSPVSNQSRPASYNSKSAETVKVAPVSDQPGSVTDRGNVTEANKASPVTDNPDPVVDGKNITINVKTLPEISQPDPAVNYLNSGINAFNAGRYDESIRYLEVYWKQRPEDGRSLPYLLGPMWWGGYYQEIVDFLNKVPKPVALSGKTDVYRYYAVARAYRATGRSTQGSKGSNCQK